MIANQGALLATKTCIRGRIPGSPSSAPSGKLRTDGSSSNLLSIGERFRTRLLYPVRGVAVIAHDHKFRSRRAVEVAELADEPLLLLRGEFASRDWFETACRLARIRPRVLLETAAPHTSIALAAAGYGVAVVPSTVVIPAGQVRGIPLLQRGTAIGRWLRVAWQPERTLSVFAQRFVDELWAHCQRDYPGRLLNRYAPKLPRPSGAMHAPRSD